MSMCPPLVKSLPQTLGVSYRVRVIHNNVCPYPNVSLTSKSPGRALEHAFPHVTCGLLAQGTPGGVDEDADVEGSAELITPGLQKP